MSGPTLTAAGPQTQTLAEIRQEIREQFEADPLFGKTAQLGPLTPLGQVIDRFAERESWIQDLAQELWDQWNPDGAQGVSADNQAGLVGVKRKEATYTKVELQVDVDSGKDLPAGSRARKSGGVIVATDELVAGDGSGTQMVWATATVTGPLAAGTDEVTVIIDQIEGGGWNSVTNPEAAIPGTYLENDTELLDRRDRSLEAGGTARPAAIRARLEELADVQAAAVIENTGLETDSRGIPGKSYRPVIHPAGLDGPTLIRAIWEVAPAGIYCDGTHRYTVTDKYGEEQEFGYSDPTMSEIWVDIQVTANDDYPSDGNAQIVAALKVLDDSYTLGQMVKPWDMGDYVRDEKSPGYVPGIDHLRIRIKKGALPTEVDTTPIAIDPDEIAYFDSHISVYTA